MAEIMDVSRYQGTIDWEKVKASGTVDAVTGEGQETWKLVTLDGTET